MKYLFLLSLIAIFPQLAIAERLPVVTVGSKTFTESYILAEIIAQTIEESGLAKVKRRFGMGGTGILSQAILAEEIDIYPEYTGTISHAILHRPDLKQLNQIRDEVYKIGLEISDSLGFNNSYGIAVMPATAKKYQLQSIGDLARMNRAKIAVSHEFLKREDGYAALAKHYGLEALNVGAIEHALGHRALESGAIDVTDIYTTDAKIERAGFIILEDDLNFFPSYEGVLLTSLSFAEKHPEIWQLLRKLEGRFSNAVVTGLNAKAEFDKESFSSIAAGWLGSSEEHQFHHRPDFLRLTLEHGVLVTVSLLFSILVGIPLGILSAYYQRIGQFVLSMSGLLQTIPSLALLAFLIPLLGIGLLPSLVALFLYSLLPIVRGTYSGIQGLEPQLLEVGSALGLRGFERLRFIEMPLASVHILNGIRTSAIINVGTATLAALIGAGGYGSLILTGLSLNNHQIILQGAIPAAIMALVVHGLFEILDRLLIPKGLRK